MGVTIRSTSGHVWAKEEQWEPLWNDVVGLDSFETATQLWLKNKLKPIT
jgi:hypothetical protein